MIWKITKDICSVPLGIAAICGSVALAMLGLVVTSFMCYLFWSWVLKSKERVYLAGSGMTMEICKDCIHEEVCLIRAFEMMRREKYFPVKNECDVFKAKEQNIDIYKMTDRRTETVKQVVLANLRIICDEEGD